MTTCNNTTTTTVADITLTIDELECHLENLGNSPVEANPPNSQFVIWRDKVQAIADDLTSRIGYSGQSGI